jgi:hypothetical protein
MGFTYYNVLHDISYQNLLMLCQCVPDYDFGKNNKVKNNRVNNTMNGGGKDLFRDIKRHFGGS